MTDGLSELDPSTVTEEDAVCVLSVVVRVPKGWWMNLGMWIRAHVDGVFGQVMDRPDAVDAIRRMWDALLSEALPERASLELIGKLVSEL